ncbi:dTDP-glucose 4,6-dehydratase [Lentilactobacillus kisonensis]|uniref:dTDP-glucose 4,6-dehydratase n=2 Tax=Lentilactobacillus kisonensis TaxID=481722 RepID=H1LE44_9LACO|nr:dTDP-glucose 4,6-dehydratase [Lentilactobacillus kisonensis]EHO52730.1 dTDP-glucose 4,6-dehydratase [Lentilactobacillus kisonensis F0435]KRL22573.1 dTDP-glucose 4,6-dehydratase [Lentilactobacillus kisonensis DSM 19906 = JCM 15041]
MNILVTGGAGFIGANFIHYLLGHNIKDRVVNLDALTYAGNLNNLTTIQNDSRYIFVHGNIADPKIVKRVIAQYHIQAVVNFAAESHVDRSILHPQSFVTSNYVGVSCLLDCLRDTKVTKFVQVSTDEVYGSSKADQKFRETDALNPTSPYAATKAGADLMVLAYYKTFGINVNITRSVNNYGQYQFPEKLIPLMISRGILGQPLPLYGDGNNYRDWLNVWDNCRAIDAVLRHGIPGEIYNVAGQNYHRNRDIVDLIVKQLDLPRSQVQFVQDRPGDDQQYVIDDTKIRQQLNWHPEVDFTTGIHQVIEWYVQNERWWRPLVARVKNR